MEPAIKSTAEDALAKVKAIFNVEDVSMTIQEDPEQTIPETGAGGNTPDSHTIFVYFDSNNPHLKTNFQEEIKSTVAHEFHHAVRNRTFNWREDTLLGAMVTEGLADHFDIEINTGKPKPWSLALSEDELSRVKDIAVQEFASRKYDHQDWFFGSESRGIPKWTGYSIGFRLVGDYLLKTGKKASELVSEPAESFI